MANPVIFWTDLILRYSQYMCSIFPRNGQTCKTLNIEQIQTSIIICWREINGEIWSLAHRNFLIVNPGSGF